MFNRSTGFVFCFALLWLALPALALPALALDAPGQEDLDKALQLKISVGRSGQLSSKELAQLAEVAELCESAIKKGLDTDSEQFARQMLAGSLYERADILCRLIFQSGEILNLQRVGLRQIALPDLEKIIEYDDTFGEAYLLIAKLQLLPGGDREAARQAVDKAAQLFPDDKKMQSQVVLVHSQLQEDPAQQLEKLNRAIELDVENVEAWQARGEFHLARQEFEKAVADFERLLAQDEENPLIRLTVAQALANLGRLDDSIAQVDQVIDTRPSLVAFMLRARIRLLREEVDQAIADLDQALKLEDERDPILQIPVLIMRAQLYYQQDRNQLALDDLERILKIRPDLTEAIALRSLVFAAQGNLDAAIKDVETLSRGDPENLGWKLQLATFVNANSQPRRAIELFDDVVKEDPNNWLARRGRADAFLSIGEHEKALVDYEVVIQLRSEDPAVLNNFAWLLATSPEEAIRDGQRALIYAEKACELTNYEEAHILSTLASAHAELGDFETAVKWSQKAVERGDEATAEQLEEELQSYQQQKPWRERQQIEDQP